MAKFKIFSLGDKPTIGVIMGRPQQTVAFYEAIASEDLRALMKRVASDVAANRPKQMRFKLEQVNEGEK